MATREVFPNAPLQLVVFEARHATATRVGRTALDALSAVLGGGAEVEFGIPTLRVAEGAAPEGVLFQVVDRSRTTAVTVWPSSLVVESTDYERYERFRDTVRAAVDGFGSSVDVPAFIRIGLRYVDELHPDPPVTNPTEWSRWVDGRLVGLAGVAHQPITGLGGGVSLDLGSRCGINFRFSTVPGPAVESAGSLRLRTRPATPALVLDIDGFWQPREPERLDTDQLLGILDRVHDGVRDVFDTVVTDESRSIFRREVEVA
jgi:uncharacterized protein (TIGR04255 family)